MKAIVLISGGLDSALAAKLIKDLGIELVALNTVSPFCLCNRKDKDGSCRYEAERVSKDLGIELVTVNTSSEFLEIIKSPKYGYGSNMNPCIDCRILLFKKAKETMEKEGASFVITGEVVGQRPMSQRVSVMKTIEKEAGLEGLVLRPLTARILEPTIPEKLGWVDRNSLLSLNGRGRREQFSLAKEFGINDYLCPSGGCLLTDPEFSRRIKDLIEQQDELTLSNIQLLKVGRHFRLKDKTKLVIGRSEKENSRLESLKADNDFFFEPENLAGPSAILRGAIKDSSTLEFASRIIARYCDGATEETEILCKRSVLEEYKFIVGPEEEEKMTAYRIN